MYVWKLLGEDQCWLHLKKKDTKMQTHPLPPPPLRLLFHGVLNLNIELNTDRLVIIISIKITFRAGSRRGEAYLSVGLKISFSFTT